MQPSQQAPVSIPVVRLPYEQTGFFSSIVCDYLRGAEQLAAFYAYQPDIAGIADALKQRQAYPCNRSLLVSALQQQYEGLPLHSAVQSNLNLLQQENTFTVTTAHQPNIFTGPLYFIYKILHAIKLAASLKDSFPEYNFVPVFYMGSEDADLDELGQISVDGKRYKWNTSQTGAVGRMKVDKHFLALLNELNGQLTVLPHGSEWMQLLRTCYVPGKEIQFCTLELINALFGSYGLVVLIPDNAALKAAFVPVMQRELEERFSQKAVAGTIAALGKQYKVQAAGRDINLFYLKDDQRERIEWDGSRFTVSALGLSFSREDMLAELETHPERFSPNVILRGLFQEQVLPNIAFIGGGGEIAYWLELKDVFAAAGVPVPVLILRNSFLLISMAQQQQIHDLGFDVADFFGKPEVLLSIFTQRHSAHQISLSEEKGELNSFYQQLHTQVAAMDGSLAEHVNALQAQAMKKLDALEKKMLRSAKKQFEAEKRRIDTLSQALFPNGSLQERVDNIAGWYSRHGVGFIDLLYRHSLSLEQQFTVVTY